MIDEILIKTNVDMVNKHHNATYKNRKGIILIKSENGDDYILDLESNTDISKANYIEIVETKRTKTKVLFKNIMFNVELLERLAKGK